MRARLSILILLVGILPACARLRVEEAIFLVPEPGFPSWVVTDLADAAEDWNLDLGTELRVVNTTRGDSLQRVPVLNSEMMCGFWPAEVTYTPEIRFHVCGSAISFSVLRHELGHVLNIHEHGSTVGAVMTSGRSTGDLTDEDRDLFFESNPSFVGRGGCHVVRRLGRVVRPPKLKEVGGQVLALLNEPSVVRVVSLHPDTASPRGSGGVLPVPSGADPLLLESRGALGLIWTELGRAFLLRVSAETLQPVSLGVLPVAGLSSARRVIGAADTGGALLLLVFEASTMTAELLRIDDHSTEAVPIYTDQPVVAGELAGGSGRALLALVYEEAGASLFEFGAGGEMTRQVPNLAGASWTGMPTDAVPVIAIGSEGEVFILTNRFFGEDRGGLQGMTAVASEVIRLSPDLRQARTRRVDLPSSSHPCASLDLAVGPFGVAVAATAGLPLSDVSETRDVYVSSLEASDLSSRSAWQRLSAPQGAWAAAGHIGAVEGKLIALWYDGFVRLDADAKSRCVALP